MTIALAERSQSFEEIIKIAARVRYRGISESVARLLYTVARAVPATQAIVEIGSFVGYSTAFLGFGAKSGFGAKVHCLDAWGLPASSLYSQDAYHDKLAINSSTLDEFLGNIRSFGLEEMIVTHRVYSYRFSELWPKEQLIGLLFIDGDHSEWGAFADWFLYRPYLADGATVIFHDYGDPAVERATRQVGPRFIKDARILGTGYKGREALALTYRLSKHWDWRGNFSYAWLSAWRACEGLIPIKTLRRIKHALSR
ncbi:MAG: class I SAM-dependent methyltransferase [Candidatus Omnitrophica bacterium]|nr:class I SAM-dependent methyltransferase [Candidatus Omnitrophota bacterium]